MAAPPIVERHLPHFHRRTPVKESVRAATTADIIIATALNNGDTLDGVTLATGDRVLVKNQSSGAENGIYVVGASPARDYDVSTDDPAFGYLVLVREGTANAGKVFKNTNTSAPTIGTTALTFAEFASGSGLTIEEVDGSPTVSATKLVFPNGTLGVVGTVATYTPATPGSTVNIEDEGAAEGAADTIDFTGAGVSVAFAAGTATVNIPGGGSADDPIADLFGTPDTAFEFDTSSLTGLTAIGTATAEDADTTFAGHYFVSKAATGSVALTGRYAATPATPFTAITKLTAHNIYAANFLRVGGLFVGEATPGVIEAIHILHNADWLSSHVRYTNPTTFNATIGTDRLTKYASVPMYYAVVVNSTTDVDFWTSFDARIWLKRTDARNPSITIGSVGIVVDPENAVYGVAGAYDYLRIWNSALSLTGF